MSSTFSISPFSIVSESPSTSISAFVSVELISVIVYSSSKSSISFEGVSLVRDIFFALINSSAVIFLIAAISSEDINPIPSPFIDFRLLVVISSWSVSRVPLSEHV